MKRNQKFIFVVLILGASTFAGVRILKMGLVHFPGFSTAGMTETAKKNLYYCPMHPSYTSDRPGECPICHMRLVKFEGDPQDYSADHADHGFSSKGKNEFTIAQILKMKPGEICLLHQCKHGQCKIVMNEEIARSGKCPHCGEDLEILIKENFPAGYSKVRLTPEKQKLLGIQTEPVKVSSFTKTIRTTGMVPMDSTWYITLEIFGEDLVSLKQGQDVDIELLFRVPIKMKGKIRGISTSLANKVKTNDFPTAGFTQEDANTLGQSEYNRRTRGARVRVSLEKALNRVKPGDEVEVVMEVHLGEMLSVPKSAVFDTGTHQIIFVAMPGESFEPREIKTGVRSGELYEVESGVSSGDLVVTSGNFLIDSESRLKASLQNIASGGGHQHG